MQFCLVIYNCLSFLNNVKWQDCEYQTHLASCFVCCHLVWATTYFTCKLKCKVKMRSWLKHKEFLHWQWIGPMLDHISMLCDYCLPFSPQKYTAGWIAKNFVVHHRNWHKIFVVHVSSKPPSQIWCNVYLKVVKFSSIFHIKLSQGCKHGAMVSIAEHWQLNLRLQ